MDHAGILLLVCKLTDSGCVMGAEGVRQVGSEMMLRAVERRYTDVFPLISAARREFEEFNLLWGLYRRTWAGRQRKYSF
jgi:hypothetical protein